MLTRKAATECPRCLMLPVCPRSRCHHFWAQHASMQRHPSGNSAAAAPAPTQLSATQHLPASQHDAASPSSCLVSSMLHTSNMPPKQVRHHVWAQHAPMQRRSSGNSAVAAPAPTQLSATQHLPASGHDGAPPSSCSVFHMLQASQLATKQMRWIFCAGRPSISIADAVN